MHTEFQLPHITGRTTEEQLLQIISYLRQTALLLQELPLQQQQTGLSQSYQVRSRKFSELTVRDKLRLEGSLNGILMGTKQVKDSDTFTLQSRFSAWEPDSSGVQTLFLLGTVHGCAQVTGAGQCSWTGTEGVTVTGKAGGVVQFTLPQTTSERVIVLSTDRFS